MAETTYKIRPLRDPMERAEHENLLAEPDLVIPPKEALRFGAFEEGALLGAGALVERGDAFELSAVAVDPRRRGQGVGKALVAHMLRWAKGRPVYLLSPPELRPWFEAQGFREAPTGALPEGMPRALRASDEDRGREGGPAVAMTAGG